MDIIYNAQYSKMQLQKTVTDLHNKNVKVNNHEFQLTPGDDQEKIDACMTKLLHSMNETESPQLVALLGSLTTTLMRELSTEACLLADGGHIRDRHVRYITHKN